MKKGMGLQERDNECCVISRTMGKRGSDVNPLGKSEASS